MINTTVSVVHGIVPESVLPVPEKKKVSLHTTFCLHGIHNNVMLFFKREGGRGGSSKNRMRDARKKNANIVCRGQGKGVCVMNEKMLTTDRPRQ